MTVWLYDDAKPLQHVQIGVHFILGKAE
jgi:hypothetical protein